MSDLPLDKLLYGWAALVVGIAVAIRIILSGYGNLVYALQDEVRTLRRQVRILEKGRKQDRAECDGQLDELRHEVSTLRGLVRGES